MKREFKSERHARLSDAFPSDLMHMRSMTGPHRPARRYSRVRRYVVVIVAAMAYGLYRCLSST